MMSLVDTDASRALQRLVSGDIDDWPDRVRIGLTRFIISLVYRNPEAIASVKDHGLAAWEHAATELQADYISRRQPTDPETFAEFVAKTHPNIHAIAATYVVERLIGLNLYGPVILKMQWARMDLRKAKFPLLTSDRPLSQPYELEEPSAFITLPISPSVLFIAAHDPTVVAGILVTDPTEIVRRNNWQTVRQARRFVWATTDSQLPFIRKHFGKSGPETRYRIRQEAIALGPYQFRGLLPGSTGN
jgi:hypothetical protein